MSAAGVLLGQELSRRPAPAQLALYGAVIWPLVPLGAMQQSAAGEAVAAHNASLQPEVAPGTGRR